LPIKYEAHDEGKLKCTF